MQFTLRPIGFIYSPFTQKAETPIQSVRSHAIGRVEVDPEFSEGLNDIDGFSHIILLYIFHESDGYELQVKPFLDNELHGLFSTRYPYRPNPIGLSVVRLLKREGNILEIEGVDVLDGTPLLDIKPYVADFDIRQDTRSGWYETRGKTQL
jgi:tRNA-Thr(GGU) m(6)t(6)A37 methyltransferase TsaA